jgi:DNA-directed RNA polymerase specialized sigma24 family protein
VTAQRDNRPHVPTVIRGTVRKLSSEEVDVLVERYRSGATMIELADLFKIHRTTVAAQLRRASVETRRQFDAAVAAAARQVQPHLSGTSPEPTPDRAS